MKSQIFISMKIAYALHILIKIFVYIELMNLILTTFEDFILFAIHGFIWRKHYWNNWYLWKSNLNTYSLLFLCVQYNFQFWKHTNIVQYYSHYCKPTFIREQEIFASFGRESSSLIFLVVNQPLSYGCYNNTCF